MITWFCKDPGCHAAGEGDYVPVRDAAAAHARDYEHRVRVDGTGVHQEHERGRARNVRRGDACPT